MERRGAKIHQICELLHASRLRRWLRTDILDRPKSCPSLNPHRLTLRLFRSDNLASQTALPGTLSDRPECSLLLAGFSDLQLRETEFQSLDRCTPPVPGTSNRAILAHRSRAVNGEQTQKIAILAPNDALYGLSI